MRTAADETERRVLPTATACRPAPEQESLFITNRAGREQRKSLKETKKDAGADWEEFPIGSGFFHVLQAATLWMPPFHTPFPLHPRRNFDA